MKIDPNQTSVRSMSALLATGEDSDFDSDELEVHHPREVRFKVTPVEPATSANNITEAEHQMITIEDPELQNTVVSSDNNLLHIDDTGIQARNLAAKFQRQISKDSAMGMIINDENHLPSKHVTFQGGDEDYEMDDINEDSMTHLGTGESAKAKRNRKLKTKAFVGILFVCIVCGVSMIFHFYHFKSHQLSLGTRLVYDEQLREIKLYGNNRNLVLDGILGVNLVENSLPVFCDDTRQQEIHEVISNKICLKWKDTAELRIVRALRGDPDDPSRCYDISWTTQVPEFKLQDCFYIDKAHWFGMGRLNKQHWPLNSMSFDKTVFLTNSMNGRSIFGPVLEPYWISTGGVSIMVNKSVPLHVSLNRPLSAGDNETEPIFDNKLCLYADYKDSPYRVEDLQLSYTLCVGDNISHVHTTSLRNYSEPLLKSSLSDVFTKPIWSTSPFLQDKNFTQENILGVTDDIIRNGYNFSLVIIDNEWQRVSGDFEFNVKKFPKPADMISNLHAHGFKVIVAVNPFVSYSSRAFQTAVSSDLLVYSGDEPGLTSYWPGSAKRSDKTNIAGVIDMFPSAQHWMEDLMRNLTKTLQVDDLYWTGGQMDMQPYMPNFRWNSSSPNEYHLKIAELGAKLGNLHVQQSGYKSQSDTGMIRVFGFDSTWSGDRGLDTVIPAMLAVGLLGYPYVFADPVGGSAVNSFPSKELYIRWVQLSAFLPIMHFSIMPESYDMQTIQIAKSMIDLHRHYVAPKVLKLANDNALTSLPIIQPLWMYAPLDPECFAIQDQFLIGDNVLVAPIVTEGATNRSIYFPPGFWHNKMQDSFIHGSKWVHEFEVPLNRVAYFERVR